MENLKNKNNLSYSQKSEMDTTTKLISILLEEIKDIEMDKATEIIMLIIEKTRGRHSPRIL